MTQSCPRFSSRLAVELTAAFRTIQSSGLPSRGHGGLRPATSSPLRCGRALDRPRSAHHLHLVLRQRAGLVGADDGGRADRLAGHELPHQAVGPRHLLHGQGQRHGHAHRQAFRHGHDDDDDHVDEVVEQFAAHLQTRPAPDCGQKNSSVREDDAAHEQGRKISTGGDVADLADQLGQVLQLQLQRRQSLEIVSLRLTRALLVVGRLLFARPLRRRPTVGGRSGRGRSHRRLR